MYKWCVLLVLGHGYWNQGLLICYCTLTRFIISIEIISCEGVFRISEI